MSTEIRPAERGPRRADRRPGSPEQKPRRKGRRETVYCIVCAVLIAALAAYIFIPSRTTETAGESFSQLRTICELATVKCYFHNVAQYEQKPEGLFSYGIFQYGHKKLWFEYSGTVKLGVEFSELHPVVEGNTVRINLPQAKVLSIDSEPDSFSDTLVESGVLTAITGEDRTEAFSAAQQNMRESAENNKSLLMRAREHAKTIIEDYIRKVGEKRNIRYTIVWTED